MPSDIAAAVPELPDITLYLDSSPPHPRQPLERLTVRNPFVLRSVEPSPAEVAGTRVTGLRRMGKRIVLELEGDRFVVIHLMIAGRLALASARRSKRRASSRWPSFEFPTGVLLSDRGRHQAAGLDPSRRRGGAPSASSIAAGSRCSTPIRRLRRAAQVARTTRSNARSPIRGSSAGSATRTRMRSSIAPGSRRWRSPEADRPTTVATLYEATRTTLARLDRPAERRRRVTAFRRR